MATRLWVCDVCGKTGKWGPTWSRYSSIALDETCPDDVPVACSDECSYEVIRNIKTNKWQLPVLRMEPGGFRVSKGKVGY